MKRRTISTVVLVLGISRLGLAGQDERDLRRDVQLQLQVREPWREPIVPSTKPTTPARLAEPRPALASFSGLLDAVRLAQALIDHGHDVVPLRAGKDVPPHMPQQWLPGIGHDALVGQHQRRIARWEREHGRPDPRERRRRP